MNTLMTNYGDAPGLTRKAFYTGRQVGATFVRPDYLKTSNDTRGVVNYDLAIGDIVQFDPFSPLPSANQSSTALATTQAGLNATLALGGCVGAPNVGSAYRAASASADVTKFAANIVPTPADGVNTGIFQPRLFVVTHVHPDVNRKLDPTNSNASLAAERAGGWIDICPFGVCDALFYKNTDILVAAGSMLGLYMPATSAAVSSVFTFGSSTAGTGKPAFTNILAAEWARTITTASTTISAVMDCFSRIQAMLLESDATLANGGTTASTTALRKVAVGGLLQFGV